MKSTLLSCSIRKVRKKPRSSRIIQIIKELGGKINLLRKIRNPRPFQVLITDFTRIHFSFGCLKLILYVDLASKRITGWFLDRQENTKSALKAWQKTKRYLQRMKVNFNQVIVHQDQGSPFTSYEYVNTLTKDNVALSYSQEGFKENQEMESVNGHFKEEYKFFFSKAKNIKQVRRIISQCIRDWNRKRLHSSIGYQSPDQFLHTYFSRYQRANSKNG